MSRPILLRVALGVALVAAVLLAVSAYRAHAGGASGRAQDAPTRYRTVEAALRARLDQQGLSYRWVVCTPMSQRFQGNQVSRCNVDFGDPHIEPYCAVLIDGALMTDHENRALDCGPRVRADELGGIPRS